VPVIGSVLAVPAGRPSTAVERHVADSPVPPGLTAPNRSLRPRSAPRRNGHAAAEATAPPGACDAHSAVGSLPGGLASRGPTVLAGEPVPSQDERHGQMVPPTRAANLDHVDAELPVVRPHPVQLGDGL